MKDIKSRFEAFMKQAQDVEPVPLVEEGDGPVISLELGLGVYDINPEEVPQSIIDAVVMPGEIREELLEQPPSPQIEKKKLVKEIKSERRKKLIRLHRRLKLRRK